MFPHEPAAVNAGLVTDPGHGNMPNGPLDTRCGDYGEPLPLQNLGSLAQPYKGGNTRVPPSIRVCCLALASVLPSRGSAHPSHGLHILSRDHAPRKILALRTA